MERDRFNWTLDFLQKGKWYELSVRAEGNQIEVLLNGTNAFPTLTDNSFNAGYIGFITKSDTTALFADASIRYRPLETLAAALVRQALEQQPRLLNLRLYGTSSDKQELRCLAARIRPISEWKPAKQSERFTKRIRPILAKNQKHAWSQPPA